MLQSIRESLKGILLYAVIGIICIPFALFGINEYFGDGGEVIVAQVNGEEISRQLYEQSFQREYQRYIQQLRSNMGADFDISAFEDNIRENLRQQVLVQMINTETVLQEASKQGLRVSDGMLSTYIQTRPDFQQGGQFSKEMYANILYSLGMSSQAFENDIREQMLMTQVQEGIIGSALLTNWEQQQYAKLNAQEREIQYVVIPANRFAETINVTDDDILAHYEANQSKYVTPERVSIEYVELSQAQLSKQLSEKEQISETGLEDIYKSQIEKYTTPPTWTASHILLELGEDETASQQQAEEVFAKANAGEDFGELARAHSADTVSAQKDGDLGTFGPGRQLLPLEEALKTMQPGEIKGPIKTRFGWHILKLVETTPSTTQPFAEVRAEILNAYQLEKAETEFYGRLDQFSNLAFEQPDNLDVLADEMGLTKQTSGLFDRRGGVGVLSNPKITAAAFSVDVLSGQNSEILELGERDVMVIRIKQHEVPQPKPLEEVKEQIRTELEQTVKRNAARELGEQILATLQAQPGLDSALQKHDLQWTELIWAKRRDTAINRPQITVEAFKMGRPEGSTPLYTGLALGDDYALIALNGVKDGEISDDITEEAAAYARAFGESAFQWVVAGIKARSDIELYTQNITSDDTL